MPRTITPTWDETNKRWFNKTEGEDEDTLTKGKLQDASKAGKAKPVAGGAFTPPAMRPGEDSASYGARVAAARREWEAKRRP